MAQFEVEVIQSTWFRVTADTKEDAEEIAIDWATDWSQPEDAVIEGRGGIEVGEVIDARQS
jgi:hypothetical protein